MTNQERINKAAEQIDIALQRAQVAPHERRVLMDFVWDMALTHIADEAHSRLHMILQGLRKNGYTPELTRIYLQECVDLSQHDELEKQRKAGIASLADTLGDEGLFQDILQLLAEEYGNEEYDPDEAESIEAIEILMESVPVKISYNDTADWIRKDGEPEESGNMEPEDKDPESRFPDTDPEDGPAGAADEE